MILTFLVVVLLCVAHDLAILGYQRLRPAPASPSILDERLRQTVVVTLKTGETYRGVLFEQDPACLVVRGVEVLRADGTKVGVDGELLILRGDISYIQRP